MNKLRFNEGGQPMFLNDLELLQNNMIEVWDTILKLLADGEEVFVLDDYPYEVDQTVAGQKTMTFPAGILVVRGELYAYDGASLTTTDIDAKPYICLQNTTDDVRLFEDGQERPCRTIGRAYLSYDTTGVEEYYYFTDLVWKKTLPLLLKKKLELNDIPWVDIPVTFYNGFTGQVQRREIKGETYIRINIKSNNETWATNVVAGSPGGIFKADKEEDLSLLYNHVFSVAFIKGSYQGWVDALCLANDMGVAYLRGACGQGIDTIHAPRGVLSCELKLSSYVKSLLG